MFNLKTIIVSQLLFVIIFFSEIFINTLEVLILISIINLLYLAIGLLSSIKHKQYIKTTILGLTTLFSIYVLIGSFIFRDGIF